MLIVAIAVCGIGGYLIGKNAGASKYKEEIKNYEEQEEIVTELNRSELDGLGKIEGPIYVTGHKSPDADTVGSSIAYAELLQQLGYDAQAVVFGEINKEYEAGGKKYGIGCIDVYDEEEAKNIAARMKDVVPKTLASTGMDMAFAQISVFHDDLSLAYLIPSDETADEVLKTAFGDKADFDGTSYVLKPGISRKKEMVPAITDVLESSPKE